MFFSRRKAVMSDVHFKLDKQQFKELHAALLSAFPTPARLEMMVKLGLDENLDAIAGGRDLTVITYELLGWAESRGRVEELIVAAVEGNPGNPELRSYQEKRLRTTVSSGGEGAEAL